MVEIMKRWLGITFGKGDDSEILKARKRIVVSIQLLGMPLAIGFIIFFFAFSNYLLLPGFFVILYLVQDILGLVLLAKTKRFEESVWFFISAVIIMALGIHIV